MIIVDPVVMGDAAFSRPSPKWVYDRTGTLVEVPANTLGVTYDPSDLSKAPYALIELEPATNLIRNNTMQGAVVGSPGVAPANWALVQAQGTGVTVSIVETGVEDGINYIDVKFSGTSTVNANLSAYMETSSGIPWSTGQSMMYSVFLKLISGTNAGVNACRFVLDELGSNQAYIRNTPTLFEFPGLGPLAGQRVHSAREAESPSVAYCRPYVAFGIDAAKSIDFTIRIGLPQLERDKLTSPIKTSGNAVTRAADVIGAGAGLIYSNVPMVEPPYNAATTYAKDAAVYDPVSKIVYLSMQAANVGKPLIDGSWWNKRTAANRWAMFDERNSTQTSNPEEIIAVVSAKAITRGAFLGALEASEVRISMTHPTRGLVYSEARNLVLPRSGSSFFGWCFNRLRLRTWFRTLSLPMFANALVTIAILKPGGVPKCGMAMLGPVEDVGLSLMGLSTELKDYSTTTFFTDGSSDTTPRGFSKRMSIDVSVERDRVETVEDYFIKRRQKTLVFLGSTHRGDAVLVGKFSSLRKVIDSYQRSKFALQVEGVLSQ